MMLIMSPVFAENKVNNRKEKTSGPADTNVTATKTVASSTPTTPSPTRREFNENEDIMMHKCGGIRGVGKLWVGVLSTNETFDELEKALGGKKVDRTKLKRSKDGLTKIYEHDGIVRFGIYSVRGLTLEFYNDVLVSIRGGLTDEIIYRNSLYYYGTGEGYEVRYRDGEYKDLGNGKKIVYEHIRDWYNLYVGERYTKVVTEMPDARNIIEDQYISKSINPYTENSWFITDERIEWYDRSSLGKELESKRKQLASK